MQRVDDRVRRQYRTRHDFGGQLVYVKEAALAMAKLAYQSYLETFHGAGFVSLVQRGARSQTLLWASTGV